MFRFCIVCHYGVAAWFKPGYNIRCNCLKWYGSFIDKIFHFIYAVLAILKPLPYPNKSFKETNSPQIGRSIPQVLHGFDQLRNIGLSFL